MQCITLEDLSLLSTPSQDGGDNTDSTNSLELGSKISDKSALTPTTVTAVTPNAEPIYAVIDLREKYLKRQEKLNKQAENRETLSSASTSSSASSTSTSSSPSNICITATAAAEEGDRSTAEVAMPDKPPSPGYATIINRGAAVASGDHNNNQYHSKSSDKLDSGRKSSTDIRTAFEDRFNQPHPRPKSFQLYSSSGGGDGADDYEEVKLDNQLYMRDFLYLSK